MERTFRQVTAKRSVANGTFDRGVLDFDFSIGGKTVFIPSKTYFRIGMKLTDNAGDPPDIATDVAYANMAPGNLFDNCFFTAGGQTVSSIVNYAPQAHACGYRLKKSGAWLSTLGKDAYGYEPSLATRINEVSTDGKMADVSRATEGKDESVVYFMYQPPLGIMEHDNPMGSGDYRFQLNPNSNYRTACVESDTSKLPGTNYLVEVESMELYICTEKMDVLSSGTEKLGLMEHQVQSKTLTSGESNLDFTVPPSTEALSIFVQSPLTGSNSKFPSSNFKTLTSGAADGGQNTLRSIQLTYANVTKPPTRWSSEFGTNTNKLQQRYLDTQIESGQAFSPGGCETFQQWVDSGLLLHYNWSRDPDDRSTQLQIQCDFTSVEPGTNLFVVAHYSRTCVLTVEKGFISQVETRTGR